MTSSRARIIAVFTLFLVWITPLWSAADPTAYSALTGYSGKGKHPANSQTGLIIDKNSNGTHFVCFSYTLLTDKKIKGKIGVEVELLTSEGARVLHSVNNVAVERFEIGELPPSENPCAGEFPPDELDFNIGLVSECTSFQASLKSGDVVRWVFGFKKMSKLTGAAAGFQVAGNVIPNAFDLTAQQAKSVLLEDRVRAWTLRTR